MYRLPGDHRRGRDNGQSAEGALVVTVVRPNAEGLSVLDKPNSYIGKTVPRPNLDRLMQGRGLYVSDMELPRMGDVMFLRSPHAHAKIIGVHPAQASRL